MQVYCITFFSTSMAVQLPQSQQATSGEDFVATQGSVTMAAYTREAYVQIVIKQVTTAFKCTWECQCWQSKHNPSLLVLFFFFPFKMLEMEPF
jgi:hypothetical protein